MLYYFPLLSTLLHRPINWKPRLFATRWTQCGTRRSSTVESQRRTCTAKHSGKCLLQPLAFSLCYFCPFHFRPLFSGLPIAKPTPAYKGFLIICHNLRIFCFFHLGLLPLFLCFTAFPFAIYLRWSFDPYHLTLVPCLSSHLSCPPGSESILSIPLLLVFLSLFPFFFLPFSIQLPLTDWGQTKHRGVF